MTCGNDDKSRVEVRRQRGSKDDQYCDSEVDDLRAVCLVRAIADD